MMTYEAYFKNEMVDGWYPVVADRITDIPAALESGWLRPYTPPTLTAINTAILNDKTLSDNAKHALIELMRVAYEEVVSGSRHE